MTTDMNYAGNTLPGGDMNVVYPKKEKLLSSIRLEAMRDGICDYELLIMLEAKDEEKAKEIAGKIVFRFDHYAETRKGGAEVRRLVFIKVPFLSTMHHRAPIVYLPRTKCVSTSSNMT